MTKRTLFSPSYRGTKSSVKQVTKPNKYPKEWFRLRYKFLKKYPNCAHCGGPAKQVDHIVPLAVSPERLLDWYNLQSLCWPCHKKKSKEERFAYKRPSHLKPFE